MVVVVVVGSRAVASVVARLGDGSTAGFACVWPQGTIALLVGCWFVSMYHRVVLQLAGRVHNLRTLVSCMHQCR